MAIPAETKAELLSNKNVIGVGRGVNDKLMIYVTEKLPIDQLDDADLVPQIVWMEGREYLTDVIDASEVRALQRKSKHRPAPAGVSVAHEDVSAGTLGSPPVEKVQDAQAMINEADDTHDIQREDTTYFLTNAHVAAPVGDSLEGDPVLQPGPYDGGTGEDMIGRLAEWSTIEKDEPNTTDSALVEVDMKQSEEILTDNEIYEVGKAAELRPDISLDDPDIPDEFTKSGRTTGVTSAKMEARDVSITVRGYYPNTTVEFDEVDAFGPMSAGGDSGSLIGFENDDGHFVATHLLFAGSPEVTFGIPLQNVFDEHGELELVHPVDGNDDDERDSRSDFWDMFCDMIGAVC